MAQLQVISKIIDPSLVSEKADVFPSYILFINPIQSKAFSEVHLRHLEEPIILDML